MPAMRSKQWVAFEGQLQALLRRPFHLPNINGEDEKRDMHDQWKFLHLNSKLRKKKHFPINFFRWLKCFWPSTSKSSSSSVSLSNSSSSSSPQSSSNSSGVSVWEDEDPLLLTGSGHSTPANPQSRRISGSLGRYVRPHTRLMWVRHRRISHPCRSMVEPKYRILKHSMIWG